VYLTFLRNLFDVPAIGCEDKKSDALEKAKCGEKKIPAKSAF
jgi:hypothetical protein